MLPFLSLLVFRGLLIVAGSETQTAIVRQPTSVVTFLSNSVSVPFTCEVFSPTNDVINGYWSINGNLTIQLPPSANINTSDYPAEYNGHLSNGYAVHVPATELYNGSTIQFMVDLNNDQRLMSDTATLHLQGLLGTVRNITFLQSTKTVSWEPPFSLSLTDTEHKISYCIVLRHSTSGAQIFPGTDDTGCEITSTQYTFSSMETMDLSPCDSYNIDIIPVNDVGNGNISQVTVAWFKGPEEINVTSANVTIDNCMELNQQIIVVVTFSSTRDDDIQFCSCDVTIESSDVTRYFNTSTTTTNEVICNSSTLVLRISESQLPLFDMYDANVTVQNSGGNQSLPFKINTHFVQNISAGFQTKKNTVQFFINYTEKLCGNFYTSVVLAAHTISGGAYVSRDSKFTLMKSPRTDETTHEYHMNNLTRGSYVLFTFDVSEEGRFYESKLTPSAQVHIEITGMDIDDVIERIPFSLQEKVDVNRDNETLIVTCDNRNGCTIFVQLISDFKNVLVDAFRQLATNSVKKQTIEITTEGNYSVKVYINDLDGDFSSNLAYTKELSVYFAGDNNLPSDSKTTIIIVIVMVVLAIVVTLVLVLGIVKMIKNRQQRVRIHAQSSTSRSRPPTAKNKSYSQPVPPGDEQLDTTSTASGDTVQPNAFETDAHDESQSTVV